MFSPTRDGSTILSPAISSGTVRTGAQPPAISVPTSCSATVRAFDGDDSDSDYEYLAARPPPPAQATSTTTLHQHPSEADARASSTGLRHAQPPASQGLVAPTSAPYTPSDLAEFLSQLHTGTAAALAPPRPPRTQLSPERARIPINAAPVRSSNTPALAPLTDVPLTPTTTFAGARGYSSWVLPNDRGVLPPAALLSFRRSELLPNTFRPANEGPGFAVVLGRAAHPGGDPQRTHRALRRHYNALRARQSRGAATGRLDGRQLQPRLLAEHRAADTARVHILPTSARDHSRAHHFRQRRMVRAVGAGTLPNARGRDG
ncbi:hypothetical protein ON010_g10333 [Phytophthora cinnamomi]|nr:hypothetical protein ON010_g10333 [Phytophthora cinnamomi]